jgi:hypothetical protein
MTTQTRLSSVCSGAVRRRYICENRGGHYLFPTPRRLTLIAATKKTNRTFVSVIGDDMEAVCKSVSSCDEGTNIAADSNPLELSSFLKEKMWADSSAGGMSLIDMGACR